MEVYRWSASDGGAPAWNLEQTLIASDAYQAQYFGSAVSLDSSDADQLIVGSWAAPASRGLVAIRGAGEAYVFERSGSAWTQATSFACPDPTSVEFFGWAVGLSGPTAVVGWPWLYPSPGYTGTGAVVVFNKNRQGHWPPQPTGTRVLLSNFASYEYAGTSVSLVGSTMVIGAPGDWHRVDGALVGRAEVLTGSGTTWTPVTDLTPSDGVAFDQFGWSVAQSTNTIAVGAPAHAGLGADGGAIDQAGAAYVFVRANGTWSQQAELLPPVPTASGQFGISVAVASDDAVLVGSSGAKAVFLYRRSGTAWNLASTYTACLADGGPGATIGGSLSASGNLAVTAQSDAYVIDLVAPNTGCLR